MYYKGRLCKWRAQQTVNLPSNDCGGSTPPLPTKKSENNAIFALTFVCEYEII